MFSKFTDKSVQKTSIFSSKANCAGDLFIFAGEHSGDLHGGKLLNHLKKNMPEFNYRGVGGPLMRNADIDIVVPMEEFCVMGFVDVIKVLPRILKNKKIITDNIIKAPPDAVILIDYPEFNMLLARLLRKKGYQGKIIQFISPTVWAWRRKRSDKIARDFDALYTIYPFENKYYAHTSLNVKYVGNPIKEGIRNHQYRECWQNLLTGSNCCLKESLIAIFPGSRPSEIALNFPKHLAAAERIKERHSESRFAICYVNENALEQITYLLTTSRLKVGVDLFLIPSEYRYELMSNCRCALAKSGTVTLELALHGCPTVVTYEISWLDRFIGKYFLRINLPYYCIVNILGEEQTFPEIIEHNIDVDLIAEKLEEFYMDTEARQRSLDGCQKVNDILGDLDPNETLTISIREQLK